MDVVAQTRGLGGWDIYGARDGSGSCAVVNASDLGLYDAKGIVQTFIPVRKNEAGYDPVCDCYCWGYRPKSETLLGLGGLGAVSGGWKVCNASGYSSQARCPCTGASAGPTAAACPPLPPPPPPCPTCPTPGVGVDRGPEQFGVTIGLLMAAALTGGVGYYVYKKRKKKR